MRCHLGAAHGQDKAGHALPESAKLYYATEAAKQVEKGGTLEEEAKDTRSGVFNILLVDCITRKTVAPELCTAAPGS